MNSIILTISSIEAQEGKIKKKEPAFPGSDPKKKGKNGR